MAELAAFKGEMAGAVTPSASSNSTYITPYSNKLYGVTQADSQIFYTPMGTALKSSAKSSTDAPQRRSAAIFAVAGADASQSRPSAQTPALDVNQEVCSPACCRYL